ncbi:hypothetical protein [Arthrobacter sp. Z4-13]
MAKVAGRKKRIIGTTVALVAISGGAAFAYWTASGAGDTTTTAAAASTNFTITSSVAGNPLSPNGPIQTVTFTVTNPATGSQKVTNVVATVAGLNGTAWTSVTGCSKDDFRVVGPTNFPATEIAAGEAVTGTVTLQMIDRPGVNQDGCKGADVPLHFAAS